MSEETKREELRQAVWRMYEESLAYKFWQGLGSVLSRFPGLRSLVVPLWFSSFVVIVLCILVSALVAWALGVLSPFLWENPYVFLVSFWLWIAINLVDWQIRKNLTAIKVQALEMLELPQGEQGFLAWVKFGFSRRYQFLAVITYYLLIGGGWTITMNFDFTQPLVWVLLLHFALGLGLWIPHLVELVLLIVFYGYYFRRLSLCLFQDDPAGTVSLQILHRCSGQLLLVSALIAALAIPVGVFTNKITTLALVISAIGLWIPLLLFYISTESAFSNHIGLAKNQRLTQLQNQISELEQKTDPPDVDRIKLVRELMEFHEQIKHTPKSLINMDSLLNLFGSLALPFLGALLNILDIWNKLFGTP